MLVHLPISTLGKLSLVLRSTKEQGPPKSDKCNFQYPMEKSRPRIPTNYSWDRSHDKVSTHGSRITVGVRNLLRGRLWQQEHNKGQHEISEGVAKSVIYQGNM